MPVFSKITTTLSAVLALTSTVVHAAPLQPSAAPDHNYHLSTHRRHVGASNLEFVSYHPPSSYKNFHDGDHSLLSRSTNATHSLFSRAPAGPSGVSPEVEEAALSYLSQQTGLPKDSLKVRSGYTNDIGVTHVYLTQLLNGIPVTNGVANISFDKTGKVVAFGSNMVQPDQISPATPAFPQSSAIQSAQKALGITHYDAVPVTLSYVLQPAPSGTDPNRKWAMLTHQFQLRDMNASKWVQAHVDATNPKQGMMVHVVDFVADATAYNVVELSQQDPTWSGFKLLTDPQDSSASPDGWHSKTGKKKDTSGNNVISYIGADPSSMPIIAGLMDKLHSKDPATSQETSTGPEFKYQWDGTAEPSTSGNQNVARVNAFYLSNKFHDIMYKYGFTEKSYNFQNDNFGKEGKGNDRVQLSVQDTSGTNNANFATPPDGQSGQCRMFTWTFSTPERDGALSNDIITHELTHGLTNRMTGGGTGECLQTNEAGGMGEGWSDTVAFWSEQNSTVPVDWTLGSWVFNNSGGLRKYPYSTNMKTNPYTYQDVDSEGEVHGIGEVWATMLVEVYWALVEKHGFNKEITNVDDGAGNIAFLHLLVDALALQTCNPTFLQARDAIIKADECRYGGANKCTIWKAFAKRGLGVNAANYKNDNTLPGGC